jgi:hypothetical protein
MNPEDSLHGDVLWLEKEIELLRDAIRRIRDAYQIGNKPELRKAINEANKLV